ncbi:MAG: hypothetical protein DRQ65_02855 [Gammaproteobacteria bacterium]|nr:MAG: hypothetical protein DRQ65_02855 [Gammaproteobacteria bacterium]
MFKGKTTLFMKSMDDVAKYYNPIPEKVFLLFQVFQKGYVELKEKLRKQGVAMDFTQATTFGEEDMKLLAAQTTGQYLVVMDDSTMSSIKSESIAKLTTISRHYRASLVIFWHLLFAGYGPGRIISLNTSYFFLLASPRMLNQLASLGGQLNIRKPLVSAYTQAVAAGEYSYILLDLCPETPSPLRIRGNIFTYPEKQVVFIPKI